MTAPVLAVGDGALGFWKAIREVSPTPGAAVLVPRQMRTSWTTWRRGHSQVKGALRRSSGAETKAEGGESVRGRLPGQVSEGGHEVPGEVDGLLAFYEYPAEHWIHLRTTNPIESAFATVRLRQRVTKGPGSRAAGIAMAFKLIESAQARWRAVNAPRLVALWSVPAPASRRANSSNDPTNQEVISKSRDKKAIHRGRIPPAQ